MVHARQKKNLVKIFVFMAQYSCIAAAPAAISYDPAITHNIMGKNPPAYKKPDLKTSGFYITPFYQTSAGGRNELGKKVPAGDRLGRLNMLALFFGRAAAPTDKPFSPASTPDIDTTDYATLEYAYKALRASNAPVGAPSTSINYTNEDTYGTLTPDVLPFTDGCYSIKLKYERVGLRGGFVYTSKYGLGCALKTGFSEYSQRPLFNDLTGTGNGSGAPIANDQLVIKRVLTNETSRNAIFKQLGYIGDYTRQNVAAFEDTHLQIHCTVPVQLHDKAGAHVVDIVPFLAVGTWLPTGPQANQDILFSLPMGNEGFTGFTMEAALSFDFKDMASLKDDSSMIKVSFGGGTTLFNTKDFPYYRVPSSKFQRLVYPWATSIRKRLGNSWNVYATVQSEAFIEGLSFYGHYVYTVHNKDSITLLEQNPERAAAFEPGLLEDLSAWKSQNIQLGIDYEITKNLRFGCSGQFDITGVRTYRPVTLLGQVTFAF